MTTQQLKHYARLLLRPLMPGWPDEGRRIVQGPLLRRLLQYVISPRTVLNAGAGEGLFSGLILEKPGVLRLVELDYYGSYHREAADLRQHFVGGSLTAIPAPSGSFDLVLCTEVLEHIADDAAALDEIRRVLAPGGWLLITVPMPPAVYDPNHVREGYTATDLADMLRARGLKIVATTFCMHGGFKMLMRLWRRYEWMPRASIWCLALADRFWPIGHPMDLMILSRLPAETVLPVYVPTTGFRARDEPQSQATNGHTSP